jgi:hypothetical protein
MLLMQAIAIEEMIHENEHANEEAFHSGIDIHDIHSIS